MKMQNIAAIFLALSLSFLFGGCKDEKTEENEAPAVPRETRTTVLTPEASGVMVQEKNNVSLDASNLSEGYMMVRYGGAADKAKLQVTGPSGSTYTYTLLGHDYEAFSFPDGNGKYHVDVLELAYDNMYALLFSTDLDVSINDEFKPFLYPNQYVWFTKDDKAVSLARELSEKTGDDLGYVREVYHYVIGNIVYDTEEAENVQSGYVPVVDEVLETKKGICFDYASLMAAMLRSQGVPTKLLIGYSGEAYHAWISVYIKDVGWIDNVIQFDGKQWSLIDPTLAANNDEKSVKKYVGDGGKYLVKYSY